MRKWRIQEFFTLRLHNLSFFVETFLLYDSEQFDINIIEIHFIWGNCNKISFSNLPALKTPVNRHSIGCHTRYTCHSKILYLGPREDQSFA